MTAASADRIVVIGGGLVGLATALRISQLRRDVRITVLEKEVQVGQHQSTHNSGVLHAGLYYRPGSLKARLAVDGLREMLEFCRGRDVPYEQCGKLVVATSEEERVQLHALLERGRQNCLNGLEILDAAEIRRREPNVAGVAALHVPEEGIVDFGCVATAMASALKEGGVEIRQESEVVGLHREGNGWKVSLRDDSELDCDFVIGCAGLHADRLARMAGLVVDLRIVPFRGEYYALRPDSRTTVQRLIYPVADPRFPFLGVHFTPKISGGVEVGPNAVLAFAREGYRRRDVSVRDLAESLSYPGLWAFLRQYPTAVLGELYQSLSKRTFAAAAARLVPGITERDLGSPRAGVRAQAISRNGALVEDFAFAEDDRCIFVLNAPSPAATASLAIGGYVATLLQRRFAA